MLKKMYYLIVFGEKFERATIECVNEPTEEEISMAIKKYAGINARVEERYKLIEKE